MPDPTSNTPPNPPPAKPGYKTTEFYLSLVAMLLTALYASGAIKEGSDASWVKAVASLAAALTALGYSVSRGMAKKS